LDGEVVSVRRELAKGADPSQGDDAGYTPLHAAVQEGRPEVTEVLLAAGADPNAVDKYGNGPLWTAIFSAPKALKVPLIRLLLKAGADPQQTNQTGKSSCEMAYEIGEGLEQPFAEAGALPKK
jgi:ankyrin repeat protein